MQFIFDGTFYKIARITGPAHNMLALRLVERSYSEPLAVRLLRPTSAFTNLNAEAVANEALGGVEEANRVFGTQFCVAEIQYLQDDTPPESIYRQLAFSLIEHIARKLPFRKEKGAGVFNHPEEQ